MENKFTNWFFLLWAAVIVSVATLLVGNSFIKANENSQQTNYGIANTISVAGEGKTTVSPDTFVINLSISELASGTQQAQKAANDKFLKISAVLKANGVNDKSIQTKSVSVYPEYDRSASQRKLLWYRAQQSLEIKINGDNFVQSGSDVIDQVAKIGNINVDNTSFELKDKNKAMEVARQKAFDDAKEKAEQLAKVGGVRLGKPLTINDTSVQYYPSPIMYAKSDMAVSVDGMWWGEGTNAVSSISAGENEVTININVVFQIN